MKSRNHGDDLVTELEKRIEGHRLRRTSLPRRPFRRLAAAMLHRADERFLLGQEDVWLEHAEGLLAFVRRRRPGQILVRVGARHRHRDARSSVVNTCMRDQPFLVDSLRLCFQQRGIEVQDQVNMILPIERTPRGELRAVGEESSEFPLESITHFEISPVDSKAAREELRQDILWRLTQARAVVEDFGRMRGELRDCVNRMDRAASLQAGAAASLRQAARFLDWLADDHFVFMGTSRVTAHGRVEKDGRCGLARLEEDRGESLAGDLREFLAAGNDGPVVFITKTGREATLHREGKIDAILVRRSDPEGRTAGCLVVQGLFTYRALQARGSSIPLLRAKLDELVVLEDVRPQTYNYKAITNAFDALPLEYLFAATVGDLQALIRRSLAAERSRRLQAHLSLGRRRRSAYLFVVMPRNSFSDALRQEIEDHVLDVLGANYSDHRVVMSAYGVAVLHFYFTSPSAFHDVDPQGLERSVVQRSASWQDRFREALSRRCAPAEALRIYRLYQDAFRPRYRVSTEPEQAVVDCEHLEKVRGDGALRFGIYADAEDQEQGTLKLRIYASRELHLTDTLPILDNFGLRVIDSFRNAARLADRSVLHLHTFQVHLEAEHHLEADARREVFLAALAAVFDGRMANDSLNRVLLPAGLTWAQMELLRSYQGYSKQLGHLSTPGVIWPTLVRHASIVRRIVDLFEARFGPGRSGRIPTRPSPAREARCKAVADEIYRAIDAVESYREDRLLRLFTNLVESTLRTNVFARHRPHPTLAHKLDCARVASMPSPRPWREIYVHHPELEGVHLRGGRIARGGLRWSDRNDDFRTEILGLMTTQMVKNVVIVPVGAKGGFVLKRPPEDPTARRRRADELYEVFIHALLDLTDDVTGARPRPPRDVVCYDAPDPYLVVAADKGTAHLSDTANAISQGRSFWLADAFASGGSHGYDHKAIGITARGAWVCIGHLLAELGIHPASDPFTAVGIGDMGGDVFGNGMLEHPALGLVAAFNHLHIFLDPTPDRDVAYRERERLFKARAGGWDQYDSAKISKGGGVFLRAAKSIPLSTQARQLLATSRTSLSGDELVHEILKLPVDLLYNGGIGTYVKASTEGHVAARDPANDAVRIDAAELKAKVVGEGGNLGLTQRARIEYARKGGRINTDFIDNAGGVNISDHEVNLKILLKPRVDAGSLSSGSRNRLLRDIEPLVTRDVLDANGDQALLLSLDEQRSRYNLAAFDGLMDEVCRRFGLKRSDLELPSIRDVDARMEAGEGLTRPELAILSSYVKMMLYDDLVDDPMIEMDGIRPALHNYFPARVTKRFRRSIDAHRLGREIALTRLTNRIIDHTGITFFSEMAADAEASPRRTFEAYSLLARASDAWQLKARTLALGREVPTQVKYEALLTIESALRGGTLHLLEAWPEDRTRAVLSDTAPYARKLRGLADAFPSVLDGVSLGRAEERATALIHRHVPADLAHTIAVFAHLPSGLAVLEMAEKARCPLVPLARDYYTLGRASFLLDTVQRIEDLRAREFYDALALRSLRRQLAGLHRRLVLDLLSVRGSAEEKLGSLGPGREAFAALERIPEDKFGPAAIMVIADRIAAVLR